MAEGEAMEDVAIVGALMLVSFIFIIGTICIDWYVSETCRFDENEE